MWERFSYYGMRAILLLYMTKTFAEGGLGLDEKYAGIIYGRMFPLSGICLCREVGLRIGYWARGERC